MKWLLLAIVGATLVVNGQESKPHSNTHAQDTAAKSKDATSTAGQTVIVVNQQTPQGEQDNHPSKPPSYFHELLLPQNIPNLALVLVGIAGIITALLTLKVLSRQALSMRRQTTHLRRSVIEARRGVRAAKNSADAALLNAQAVINAERPWIIVEIRQPYMGKDYDFSGRNCGRTPAEIISISARTTSAADEFSLPPQPEYGTAILAHRKFIPPRGTFEVYHFSGDMLVNQSPERDDIRASRKRLIVYGNVRYLDVLAQREHETRFCYWFAPVEPFGSMLVGGPEGYNQHT